MTFVQLTLVNLSVALAMMLALWAASLVKRDASIVDPFWGFGFVILGWVTLFCVETWNLWTWTLLVMVSLWGLRLSAYLLWRNRGKGEDRRYTAMRDKHGRRFWWVSLFTVFGLQGLVMWFVSLPIQAGMYLSEESSLGGLVAGFGVVVWGNGMLFETVGDFQMARFKARPDSEGKVMDQGLWRYTRHPNYFGDFCVWWGHYLVAASGGAWWTILSPVIMSFLLMKVSGVALLESDMEERRPEYRDYVMRTNAFFPGPPKR